MEFFFNILIFILLLNFVLASFSFAPWVPSRKRDLQRAFEMAKMKPGEIFYDLGCWDGRMVFFASKNYGVRAIGVELSLLFFTICKIREFFIRNKLVSFRLKDLRNVDLRDADVVYLFGITDTIAKIGPKIQKELKQWARIISYAFPIEGLTPEFVSKPNEKEFSIYLYVKK